MITEAEACIALGVPGCVVALSGVLMGENEVSESCDGDKSCHSGKGASNVAKNANEATVFVATGTNAVD